MSLLEGRVAWVTGASRGIGRAIAVGLAQAGANVLCSGRSQAQLEETIALCTADGDPQGAAAMQADVNNRGELHRCVDACHERWGALHILVNNAGTSGLTPVTGGDAGPWDNIISTNLSGTFYAIRASAPRMATDGTGRILNISSVLGRFGAARYAAYCASKHGLIGLTRAVALELAEKKITVNAVCPGWVDTQMARHGIAAIAEEQGLTEEQAAEQAAAEAPLGEILQPKEVADLVVFLCSDAARSITGQAYNVCGGQAMS